MEGIEKNKSLVRFGYGFDSSKSKTNGMISFDTSTQAIYVGDGSAANLVTSSVKDASFVNNVLTITKVNRDEVLTLDFSDIAKNTDLTAHTGSDDIHVTAEQKRNWQGATDAINAFLAVEGNVTEAIDTLKDIQDFLTSDDGTVQTLLNDVSIAQSTAKQAADDASAAVTAAAAAKSEAISTVTGTAGDASTAKTIEGTRTYVDEKVSVIENQLTWIELY